MPTEQPTADRTLFSQVHSAANVTAPHPETGEPTVMMLPVFLGKQIARSANRRDVADRYEDLHIIDVRQVFPDDSEWKVENLETDYKRYIAVHHDAVAFPESEAGFSAVDVFSEFARMRAIWLYHRNVDGVRSPGGSSWNGIGYHFLIAPSGRVYMAGSPETHRAHVKGLDKEGVLYNRRAIGICFMGNYGDRKDPTGRTIPGSLDRPDPQAVTSFIRLVEVLTIGLKRPLDLHPHKFYQPDTACPGDWASPSSWGMQQPPPIEHFNDIPDLDEAMQSVNEIIQRTVLIETQVTTSLEAVRGDMVLLRDWLHDLRNIRDNRTPS